jgi:glutamate-1-semialdehyde 2,1-aminomutase
MIAGNVQGVSERILADAGRYIAGGVVSLNRKVYPSIVFAKGKGSRITDVDGKEYIDYHAAFAPFLLGHNHEAVNQAVVETISSHVSLFGSGTGELEAELAKLVCNAIASLDLVQITNTGSEATAHAIRLSRAYTGRDHIILTLGGYNGWHNDVARAVMPTLEQIGPRIVGKEYPFIASSAGIPQDVKSKVHLVNFNDLEAIEEVMKKYPVACVLTEPVLQNVGIILPQEGYLQGVISLCKKYNAVSIFDEVKTGFRSALGGYQSIAGVQPDLSVFGKAIANGYPLGIIGGRKSIMELFDDKDPNKRVLIAGTYNAHPVNTAAAIATINILNDDRVYKHIQKVSNMLYSGLEEIFSRKGIPFHVARNASASCIYFSDIVPSDIHDILNHHDFAFDLGFRKELIKKGVYQIPLPCKQNSVSYAHTTEDISFTLEKVAETLQDI